MNEQSIFLQALDKPTPEQRAAWLDEVCGADVPLRRRVEALLRRHELAGSFLEKPAAELQATILPGDLGNNRVESLQAGLAAAFTEEQAVVLGDGNHSVLKMLGQTLDKVPGVALRDSVEAGAEPITKPKSPEMPQRDGNSRYRLDGEIARGGMGAILKGRDTDLGRDLAIKVLLDEHKAKPEVIQRFVEEAQIGGQLQHPGIVPVYELGQFSDQRPFFSMKLVKGKTLSKLLAERADSCEDRGKFIGIFEQVCQTMAYAHSRGVIHRDLKPANIMVGAFGEVQVMDWGLAKVLPVGGVADEKKSRDRPQGQSIIQTLRSGVGSDSPGAVGTFGSHTQMGSVMGTPAYMPPEQALGEIDNLDERADVFGLGAILCEILTGDPPYVGDDGTHIFRLASRGKLTACFERLAACAADTDLITLAKHCLELEPADRPPDAGALAERVTGYLESVETKLRETEMQRAAQEARADAEASQAEAERQRAEAEAAQAEAERQRAEAERQRAEAEGQRLAQQQRSTRKLRKMLVGLAVVAFIAIGASIVAGNLWKKAEQNALLAKRNEGDALTEAQRANEQKSKAESAESVARAAESSALAAKNTAEEARAAAVAAEREGRRLLYVTDMQLAPMVWADDEATLQQFLDRLDAHDPDKNDALKGKEDLRGFEWYYYKHLPESRSVAYSGHSGAVMDAAFTEGGQLVTQDRHSQIRHWDHETRQATTTRSLAEAGKAKIDYYAALSADGQLVAFASGDKVHVQDADSGEERFQVEVPDWDGRKLVRFSPDCRILMIFARNLYWIDVASGHSLGNCEVYGSGSLLSTSADGLTVVSVGIHHGKDCHGCRLDPDTKIVDKWHGKLGGDGSDRLEVSPDGSTFVTGSQWNGTLHVYDTKSMRKVFSYNNAHASSIYAIAFSPDGSSLLTASDGTIKLWKNPRKPEHVATFKGHNVTRGEAAGILFTPDGGRAVSCGIDGTVRIWNLSQSSAAVQPLESNRAATIDISPDGLLIAGATQDGLTLWDTATGRRVKVLSGQQEGEIYCVAFSPNNRFVAAGHIGQSSAAISLWDIDSARKIATYHDAVLYDWEVAPDGILRPVIPASRWMARALAFSPDGTRLVAAFSDRSDSEYHNQRHSECVWDVASGQKITKLDGHTSKCVSIAFSGDGALMVTGSLDGTARIWNTRTWETVHELRNPQSIYYMVHSVAFSPDASTVAMASYNSSGLASSILLWDVATGKMRAELEGHASAVNAVAFSPDGRTLASSAMDGTVRLWNLATNRQLIQLNSGNIKLTYPVSLAFSSDGDQLLASFPVAIWSSKRPIWDEPDRVAAKLAALLDRDVDFASRIRMFSENPRLHEALAILQQQRPDDQLVLAALAATRADWHALHQRWAEAAKEYKRLLQLDPLVPHRWLTTRGLVRVASALLGQAEPRLASGLLATSVLRIKEDGILRENMIGLRFNSNMFPLRLAEVIADSPAARAGLRAGDVIPKVKDVELTEENIAGVSSLLAGEAGTKIRLTVQHAGSDQTEEIELAKELVFADPALDSQFKALRSVIEQRLGERPNDPALLAVRAELLGLYGEHTEQIGVYTAVIDALSDDPDLSGQVGELYHRRGDAYLALGQWQAALDDFSHVVDDFPQDEGLAASHALAKANVMLAIRDWTVVKPTLMTSVGRAALTWQEDGSILVGGANPDRDIYTIVIPATLERIAAIRLEALPDSSLPENGPGRSSNGNFHLSGFRVFHQGERVPVTGVTAYYDNEAYALEPIIDDDANEVGSWSVFPRTGESHAAVFATSFAGKATDELSLELHFAAPSHRRHGLGRFRISVAKSPGAFVMDPRRIAAETISDPWTRLAAAYRVNGDDDAIKLLLEQRPNLAEDIGDQFAAERDWQRAIAIYSTAISANAAAPKLLSKRAEAYEQLDNWSAAQADWSRVFEGRPDEARRFAETDRLADKADKAASADVLLGDVLWEQGKRDEALAAYKKAIQLHPKSTNAHVQLGDKLGIYGLEKWDEAIPVYQKVIELDPKHFARIRLANCLSNNSRGLVERGKLEETIAELRWSIELDPKRPEYRNQLGLVLVQQEKLDEAVAEFSLCAELFPKYWPAPENQGDILVRQNKLDEAIAAYEKSIQALRMCIEDQPRMTDYYNGLLEPLVAKKGEIGR